MITDHGGFSANETVMLDPDVVVGLTDDNPPVLMTLLSFDGSCWKVEMTAEDRRFLASRGIIGNPSINNVKVSPGCLKAYVNDDSFISGFNELFE